MTTAPPDKPADFTASDILSADAWTGRARGSAKGAGARGGEARGAPRRLDAAGGVGGGGQPRRLSRPRAPNAAGRRGRDPAVFDEADRHEPLHGARTYPHGSAPRQAR